MFLDEIGEISPAFQAKLLRVLQEQEFERVGGNQTIKVDVRIVTATNRNLEEAVSRNEFRADLYYRISVVPIKLPPLRERRSDIPQLAHEFLRRFNCENERDLTFDVSAIEVLMHCGFPGNVRELENCVQRTATLAAGSAIGQHDFACSRNECMSAILWKGNTVTPPPPRGQPIVPLPILPRSSAPIEAPAESPAAVDIDEGEYSESMDGGAVPERERIVQAMERSGWVQAKAARLLGLTPRQIGYALKKYNIEVKRF